MTYTLYHGDCLDILPTLPAQSVDVIIADPPYGTTACKWDSVIPLDAMWRELKRVIKPAGAIVVFCGQPFTSVLVASNIRQFKYCWTWDKGRGVGHLVAAKRPLQQTEDIAVFGQGAIRYYPLMVPRDKPRFSREGGINGGGKRTEIMGGKISENHVGQWLTHSHPTTLLHFSSMGGECNQLNRQHPTQKPVELLRYLVRTHTNPGETVLDFTMGSGTTGVACAMEGRHFIGVELDAGYYDIARRRIEQVQPTLLAEAAN